MFKLKFYFWIIAMNFCINSQKVAGEITNVNTNQDGTTEISAIDNFEGSAFEQNPFPAIDGSEKVKEIFEEASKAINADDNFRNMSEIDLSNLDKLKEVFANFSEINPETLQDFGDIDMNNTNEAKEMLDAALSRLDLSENVKDFNISDIYNPNKMKEMLDVVSNPFDHGVNFQNFSSSEFYSPNKIKEMLDVDLSQSMKEFGNIDMNNTNKIKEMLDVDLDQSMKEFGNIDMNNTNKIKEMLDVDFNKFDLRENFDAINNDNNSNIPMPSTEELKTGGAMRDVMIGLSEIPGEIYNKAKNYHEDVKDRMDEMRDNFRENVKEVPKKLWNHVAEVPKQIVAVPKQFSNFWRKSSTTEASSVTEKSSRRRGGLFGGFL